MAYTSGNPRYQRQTSLEEFGEKAQQKLAEARVLVVGAGGLGSPVLQYLTGAGIGTIGIADHDLVSLNNLHRQVIYSTDDIGLSKAVRAAEILGNLNPEIEIIIFNYALSSVNALSVISQFDIIVDGTDNFASRYMINDACVLLDKTLVYGAISKFEGQVSVFNAGLSDGKRSSNYRDLFPHPPADDEIQNCEEAGVIGILPGIIGTMMANETIKLITGLGKPLINSLITYNSLNNQIYELEVYAQNITSTLIPKSKDEFESTDYEVVCSTNNPEEIDLKTFNEILQNDNLTIVDVREWGEQPQINDFRHTQIPASELDIHFPGFKTDTIVLFCQTGKRSLNAARQLINHYGDTKKVYSLKGGILNYIKLKRA